MWKTPKTDWKSTDFFNAGDYNRIKGNINEIRQKAVVLWSDFPFTEMGADKGYQDYGFYADEINAFESNLDKICSATFPFTIGERQTFYDNQPFITWDELSRIENACLLIYQNFKGREEGMRRLSFKLGTKGELV